MRTAVHAPGTVPRRPPHRPLVGPLVGLLGGAALLCGATLAAFTWLPGTFGSVSDRLWEQHLGRHLRAWTAATSLRDDPAAETASLERLGDELRDVRRLDRLAPLVRAVEQRLVELLEPGSPDRARTHAARWLAFDPNDLAAAVAYGRLSGADPATRGPALEALERARAVAPAHPHVLHELVPLLVEDGHPERAAEVLLAAARAARGARWLARWDDAPEAAAWLVERGLGAQRIELEFTADRPLARLRLEPPDGSAFGIADLTFHTDDRSDRSLADRAVRLVGLAERGGVPCATGAAGAALDFDFADRPTRSFRLVLRKVDRTPDWLLALLRAPAGQAALAASRDPELRALQREARGR